MTIPQGPNQRWSMDFLPSALADGRRFRIPVIVDARLWVVREPATGQGASKESRPYQLDW
jgi:hypothetical protein